MRMFEFGQLDGTFDTALRYTGLGLWMLCHGGGGSRVSIAFDVGGGFGSGRVTAVDGIGGGGDGDGHIVFVDIVFNN